MSKIANSLIDSNLKVLTHDQNSARLDRHIRNNPVPYRGNQIVKALARAAIQEYDAVISGKKRRTCATYDLIANAFARG